MHIHRSIFFPSKTPPVVFFLWLPVQKKFALVRAAREEKVISRGFFKEVHCPANVMESCLSRAYQLCPLEIYTYTRVGRGKTSRTIKLVPVGWWKRSLLVTSDVLCPLHTVPHSHGPHSTSGDRKVCRLRWQRLRDFCVIFDKLIMQPSSPIAGVGVWGSWLRGKWVAEKAFHVMGRSEDGGIACPRNCLTRVFLPRCRVGFVA